MFNSETPTRRVTFAVVRSDCSAERLAELIGVAPDSSREQGRDVVWELEVAGSGADDLSELIGQLLSRVRELEDRVVSVSRNPDTTIFLRIVQYIGDDQVGPGFAIEPKDVALLAKVNAVLDVDQYLQ